MHFKSSIKSLKYNGKQPYIDDLHTVYVVKFMRIKFADMKVKGIG
jgi:hypothetical protein